MTKSEAVEELKARLPGFSRKAAKHFALEGWIWAHTEAGPNKVPAVIDVVKETKRLIDQSAKYATHKELDSTWACGGIEVSLWFDQECDSWQGSLRFVLDVNTFDEVPV